ncbi:MAG: FAD-dependent oxidoreductase, partial [Candidatus Promineifilaceae bacterium]
SALLLLFAIVAAFFGGVFFKGKSGWCSSMCPILPVQRLYNQTPFALVGNSHCSSCVGCNKHCYDFNPNVATLADLYDEDPYRGQHRKFFAGAFPGFIIAFFTVPNPPDINMGLMYGLIALFVLASVGTFFLLDAFWKTSPLKIPSLYGALAFNLFYWFTFPGFLDQVTSMVGLPTSQVVVWVARVAVFGLTAEWLRRTYRKEPIFLGEVVNVSRTTVSSGAARALQLVQEEGDQVEVTFAPDETAAQVSTGKTLLEVAESSGLPIEPGCRMGVCGADPIVVLKGAENLSKMRDDEQATLERLGLSGNGRMACVSRINGDVTVSLDLSLAEAGGAEADFPFDENVRKVVIIGNGIAGVTAADHVRRRHPDCEIHLVGRESHHLYNRMAITRLIYGRSAMGGLYLMPDDWYDKNNITCWLNTQVSGFDDGSNQVKLATGETLAYDRLIMTMGSSSFVPPVKGVQLAGSFVLREAADAIQMRAYVQNHACRHAIIVGGGLLGLEAAYALFKLGLRVTVLERGPWLLRRQLDERGAFFLQQYLERLGLTIMTGAETASIDGDERVAAVELKDGQRLDCDVFLMAAGIRPNTQLAKANNLNVNRGIVVNEHMQTSLPNVYAAGDVCEYDSKVFGLWAVAVEQARIAAINAVGGKDQYEELIPVTALKVVGIELTSIGTFEAESDADSVIVFEEPSESRYRKLVIRDGKLIGAILLGYPREAPSVSDVVKQGLDISGQIEALETGDWMVLEELAAG